MIGVAFVFRGPKPESDENIKVVEEDKIDF